MRIRNDEGIGFLFAGSGTQYPGMGSKLHGRAAVFRESFDRCARLLDAWLPQPLAPVVFSPGTEAVLKTLPFMSASTFVIQIALADYWSGCGIAPSAILAHSLGGHAAAYAAGAVSLEEACELLRLRCLHLSGLDEPGGMAVVEEEEIVVQSILDAQFPRVEVAAVNSRTWITLAGAPDDLAGVVRLFRSQGVTARMHAISHAFHSSFMEPALADYRRSLSRFGRRTPAVPLFTTAGGRIHAVDEDFWAAQLRAPMNFARAYAQFREHVGFTVLEIGPDSAFVRFVHELETSGVLGVLASLSSADDGITEKSRDHLQRRSRAPAPLEAGRP